MPEPLLQSLAVVLPRYGESLGGGAETLVRDVIVELSSRALIPRIEVWTTCAKDHRTWANEYPEGTSRDGDIVVRRFPVDERDLEVFIACEHAMQQGRPLSVDEQLSWLANSVNSRRLYFHIAEQGAQFDSLLFAPYLFATSFWGALIHPDRSLLVPCLHDEPYAYLEVFHHLFSRVRGLLFNAAAEGELAGRLYQLKNLEQVGTVVGMGFHPRANPEQGRAVRPLQVAGQTIEEPYLLYSGRKEIGKNVDVLIDSLEHYNAKFPDAQLNLYLIGAGDVHFRQTLPSRVVDLGFVSEQEKHDLMDNALALCQPSVNESFSIVLMECWQHGTPVLVHGGCAVTTEHVRRSGGGLYFENVEEFALCVRTLLRDSQLRESMGSAGAQYVGEEYSWDAVIGRFAGALEKCGLAGSGSKGHASIE